MTAPVENFNYTATSGLDTLNGGAGFSGAWAFHDGGSMTVEANPGSPPAFAPAGNVLRSISTTNNTKYIRPFAGRTVETFSLWMRLSVNNPGDQCGPIWAEASDPDEGRMYVQFDPDGNIKAYNNSTYITVAAYSANTWYKLETQIDSVNQANKFRARVKTGRTWGSYTSWLTVNGGAITSIGYLMIADSVPGAHSFYVGNIGGKERSPLIIGGDLT